MNHNILLREACEARFSGKLFAFTARSLPGSNLSGLSVVVDGETGHYPLSPSVANGTRDEMYELADGLNRDRLKLPKDTATRIIAQSMRKAGRGR